MKFNDTKISKAILIGDLHIKKDLIPEFNILLQWIYNFSKSHNIPVIFLGDQYNDFGIADITVVQYMDNMYKKIFNDLPTISLIGNHDLSKDYKLSFMHLHQNDTLVIDKPHVINNILFLPYYYDTKKFIDIINNMTQLHPQIQYIICHQEFNGCMYENGFYAPHGIDIKNIQKSYNYISGHIHKKQTISTDNGIIYYTGTPKQLIISDTYIDKYIHIFDFDNNTIEEILIPEQIHLPFKIIEINEKNITDISFDNLSNKTIVILNGTKVFIDQIKSKIPSNVRLKLNYTDQILINQDTPKHQSISDLFYNYCKDYQKKHNLNNDTMNNIIDIIIKNVKILGGS